MSDCRVWAYNLDGDDVVANIFPDRKSVPGGWVDSPEKINLPISSEKSELVAMSRGELRKMAAKLGIDFAKRWNSEQLRSAINEVL